MTDDPFRGQPDDEVLAYAAAALTRYSGTEPGIERDLALDQFEGARAELDRRTMRRILDQLNRDLQAALSQPALMITDLLHQGLVRFDQLFDSDG